MLEKLKMAAVIAGLCLFVLTLILSARRVSQNRKAMAEGRPPRRGFGSLIISFFVAAKGAELVWRNWVNGVPLWNASPWQVIVMLGSAMVLPVGIVAIINNFRLFMVLRMDRN
jgi:hypothetical protein